MAQLRVEKLIFSLSEEERILLRKKVHSQKRVSLKLLFDFITRPKIKPLKLEQEKKNVFLEIFGTPYTKEKDYLLRNEYRLLTNLIYDFMAECELLRNMKRDELIYDRALFRALFRAKLWTELESSYFKFSKKAKLAGDFDTIYELNSLYASALAEKENNSVNSLREALLLFQDCIVSASMGAEIKKAKSLFSCIAAEDMINTRSSRKLKSTPICDYPKAALAKFYYHKAKSLLAYGKERIIEMECALESLQTLKFVSLIMKKEQLSAIAHLGMLYFLNNEYSLAVEKIGEAISISNEIDVPLHGSHLINHIVAILHQGDYEKAIEKIDEYKPKLKTTFKVELQLFEVFAYILLEQPYQAQKNLPTKFTTCREDTYHLSKYADAIIHFMRGRKEDAQREARNFYKRFHRTKSIELAEEKKFVKAFVDFFELSLIPESASKSRKMISIRKALNEAFQEPHFFINSLPLLWLKKQLQE